VVGELALGRARALVRQVFTSAADLRPDQAKKTLTVRLHRAATLVHDQTLKNLCAELTHRTVYPGTDLRLVYELVDVPAPKITSSAHDIRQLIAAQKAAHQVPRVRSSEAAMS